MKNERKRNMRRTFYGLMAAVTMLSSLALPTNAYAATEVTYDEEKNVFIYEESEEDFSMEEEEMRRNSSEVLFDAKNVKSNGEVEYYYMLPTDDRLPSAYILEESEINGGKVYLVDEADNVVQQIGVTASGSTNPYLSKYLPEGTYYFSIDGNPHIKNYAIVVTTKPVLSKIRTSVYAADFDTAPITETDMYITVEGTNMDMGKIVPYVVDANGNVLSEVVDYVTTDKDEGLFHLKNVSTVSWDKGTLKVKGADGYEVLNMEEVDEKVSVGDKPCVYYAEYIPATHKSTIYFANVPDGTSAELRLVRNYESDTITSTTVTVYGGKTEVEFDHTMAIDGAMDLYYTIGDVTGEYYFSTYDVTSVYTVEPAPVTGNGAYFRVGNVKPSCYVYGVADINSDFKILLYQDMDRITEAVKTLDVQKENTKILSYGMEYDGIKLTANADDLPEGVYYGFVQIDGAIYEELGFTIQVCDDNYRMINDTGRITDVSYLKIDAIFPENFDASKLELVVTDAAGNAIPNASAQMVAVTAKGYEVNNEYAVEGYIEYNLTGLDGYCSVYCQLLYNGERPLALEYDEDYYNGSYTNGRLSIREEAKYSVNFYGEDGTISGIYIENGTFPVTVKFYYPYDTKELKTVYIPQGTEWFEFTAENLAGLDYNETTCYNIYLYDENGNYLNSRAKRPIRLENLAGNDEAKEQVQNFVNRLYTLVLERECDEAGLNSWTEALMNHTSSGVDAGYGFVFSGECIDRNLSDEAFVDMLYKTFMNRDADEGGRNAWVSQLQAGVEREKILEGFILSQEFAGICAEYGISVGTVDSVAAFEEAVNHYCNQNADVTKFVARCYTEALGRAYDPVGLEGWCKAILTQENTPIVAAQSFIFSDEFVDKNLNNEEYIKVLYRTFFGREADPEGLAGWVGVLESGEEDRAKVLDGFANSGEFAEILASFGLN